MKAYTRNKFNSKVKKAIAETAEQTLRLQQTNLIIRTMKSICAELYTGVEVEGNKYPVRLSRNAIISLIKQIGNLTDNRSESYWERVDELLIDKLKLPFPRTQSDMDGNPIDPWEEWQKCKKSDTNTAPAKSADKPTM